MSNAKKILGFEHFSSQIGDTEKNCVLNNFLFFFVHVVPSCNEGPRQNISSISTYGQDDI
jgi:hypothetical protein